jgi:hypothetical protein
MLSHYSIFCFSGVLQNLLQQKIISNSSIKLSAFLLSRKPILIHDFISLIRQSRSLRQNAAVVLPLLSTAFKHSAATVEQNVLNKIYNEYSTEIQAAVLTPSKAAEWLKCYSSVVVQLLYTCMGMLHLTGIETWSFKRNSFISSSVAD